MLGAPVIRSLDCRTFRVPTDTAESDGTYAWNAVVVVVVEVTGGGHTGLGYTYADPSAAVLVRGLLRDAILGCSAFDVAACHQTMRAALRNQGVAGVGAMALSAVDIALWDLKSKIVDAPLVALLGAGPRAVPCYGSGGFTSYDVDELAARMARFVERGFHMVKMKVGRDPNADLERVRAVRGAIGDDVELFVDADGAYRRKQAVRFAELYADLDVRLFEEPVPADDTAGLHLVSERAPAPVEIAAGEYGWDVLTLRRLIDAGAVDVVQADITRCGGVTGFLAADALCKAAALPLSAHGAPSLALHACCASSSVRHMELFHDHERVEAALFDGVPDVKDGRLTPDLGRAGHGLALRGRDADAYELVLEVERLADINGERRGAEALSSAEQPPLPFDTGLAPNPERHEEHEEHEEHNAREQREAHQHR